MVALTKSNSYYWRCQLIHDYLDTMLYTSEFSRSAIRSATVGIKRAAATFLAASASICAGVSVPDGVEAADEDLGVGGAELAFLLDEGAGALYGLLVDDGGGT